jgi:signal transduction histidine kinase
MMNQTNHLEGKPIEIKLPVQKKYSITNLRYWLRVMKWLVPLILLCLVIIYELVAARWFHDHLGEQVHYLAEIAFYGTTGPVLAFILLQFLNRWLEEKETSDLQAQLLAEAREFANESNKLNDDALQTLFAVRVLLSSIETGLKKPDPDVSTLLKSTSTSLESAIKELREHLENQPISSLNHKLNEADPD